MKLCVPVSSNAGLESPVCEHFGSAPFFMIVDTDTLGVKAIQNLNQHHVHGMCHPLAILGKEKIDGIVVGGIGMGALNKLQAAQIRVFKTNCPSIKETVDAYKRNTLVEMTPALACGHHHG